ncbi:MAG: trehalase family glycosidase [Victivallales bacterium]
MEINLTNTPFSRFGSWLAFQRIEESHGNIEKGLWLKTVSARASAGKYFLRFELTRDNEAVPFTETLRESSLYLKADGGEAEICFENDETIRISARGVGVRLANREGKDAYHCTYARFQEPGRSVMFNSTRYGGDIMMITALQGTLVLDAPWVSDMLPILGSPHIAVSCAPDATSNSIDLALEMNEYPQWSPGKYNASIPELLHSVRADLEQWKARTPRVADGYRAAAGTAAYLMWSSVVSPRGILERTVGISGMIGFENIWGWDNLFEGIAHGYFSPEIAWNNLVVRFDAQGKNGAVPQTMLDLTAQHHYPPRPLEGWAMQMMRKQFSFSKQQVAEFLPKLERNTEWWFRCRSKDGIICHYWHGNDSGADNSSAFDATPWIEAPDLNAYLVLQCRALAEMARRLEDADKAEQWTRKGKEVLDALLSRLWNGRQFMVRRVDNGQLIPSTSLLVYMPVILGDLLPKDIIRILAEDLSREDAFLTPCGLASEDKRSPLFRTNGYWRGPVWPSWTMLAVDGLHRAGEQALSREIAKRYCDNVLKHGFNENYHPFSGKGNGCPSVMWAPSVFLIMAGEYL